MVKYILGLIVITVLSLSSLIFFFGKADPAMLNKRELAILYFSLFLAFCGIFTISGIFFRKFHSPVHLNWEMFKSAFYQGMVLSLILTLILFLSSLIHS